MLLRDLFQQNQALRTPSAAQLRARLEHTLTGRQLDSRTAAGDRQRETFGFSMPGEREGKAILPMAVLDVYQSR